MSTDLTAINHEVQKVQMVLMVILGAVLALRPDWFFWVASYGGRITAKENPTRRVVVRIIAGVTALICLFNLAWL